MSSAFFEVYPREPEEDAIIDIDINITKSQSLFTSKVAFPAQMLIHDPAVHKDIDPDFLLFEHFFTGGGHSVVADADFDITPSRFHLVDMSQHYQTIQQRSQSRGIFIPHAALGYKSGDEPVLTSLEVNTPAGRLLAAAHTEMLAAQEHGSEEDAALMVQTFLELLGRLMLRRGGSGKRSQDHDLPLSLLMRDFVGIHLGRPDLDVDKITSVFGVSRATLYRHFDEEGGILRYIRNRRLDRCYFELAQSQPGRGRVTAIAQRWHFGDATHFNRLFRDRFGISPSECLAIGLASGTGAPSELIRITRAWLDQFRKT
ncbi:MAG: helix-turn-helix transcriptional regulator [Pseudomonadota bacterium]